IAHLRLGSGQFSKHLLLDADLPHETALVGHRLMDTIDRRLPLVIEFRPVARCPCIAHLFGLLVGWLSAPAFRSAFCGLSSLSVAVAPASLSGSPSYPSASGAVGVPSGSSPCVIARLLLPARCCLLIM